MLMRHPEKLRRNIIITAEALFITALTTLCQLTGGFTAESFTWGDASESTTAHDVHAGPVQFRADFTRIHKKGCWRTDVSAGSGNALDNYSLNLVSGNCYGWNSNITASNFEAGSDLNGSNRNVDLGLSWDTEAPTTLDWQSSNQLLFQGKYKTGTIGFSK